MLPLPDDNAGRPVDPATLTPLDLTQRHNLEVLADFLIVIRDTMDASSHPDDVVKAATETLAEAFGPRKVSAETAKFEVEE